MSAGVQGGAGVKNGVLGEVQRNGRHGGGNDGCGMKQERTQRENGPGRAFRRTWESPEEFGENNLLHVHPGRDMRGGVFFFHQDRDRGQVFQINRA